MLCFCLEKGLQYYDIILNKAQESKEKILKNLISQVFFF
jgi:hypothetical protein